MYKCDTTAADGRIVHKMELFQLSHRLTWTSITCLICLFLRHIHALVPTFTSTAGDITVLVGDTIYIDCNIDNLQDVQFVVWQRDSTILSWDRTVLNSSDQRLTIEGEGRSSYTLVLQDVGVDDEGSYICQIAGGPEQFSRLTVNIPPTITHWVPETGEVQVLVGEVALLECKAFGKPEPLVTWVHMTRSAPSGKPVHVGSSLLLENVARSHAGRYVCSASNGAGSAVSRTFIVTTVFVPVVDVEEPLINTGLGYDVTIVCTFYANPRVEVTWLHNWSIFDPHDNNNAIIVPPSSQVTEDHSQRWVLHLHSVQPSQFGKYACEGSNHLGTAVGTAEISPLPCDLSISSEDPGRFADQFIIEWTVTSYSTLTHFEIRLVQLAGATEDALMTELNVKAPEDHRRPVHTQEYTLTSLHPDTEYSLYLRAANVFGVTSWTRPFHFRTAKVSKTAPITSRDVQNDSNNNSNSNSNNSSNNDHINGENSYNNLRYIQETDKKRNGSTRLVCGISSLSTTIASLLMLTQRFQFH